MALLDVDLFEQLFHFQHVAWRRLDNQRARPDIGDNHQAGGEVGARPSRSAGLRASWPSALQTALAETTLATALADRATRGATGSATADRLLAEERADGRLRLRGAHVFESNHLERRVRLDGLVQFLNQIDHRRNGFGTADQQQRVRLHEPGNRNLSLTRLKDLVVNLQQQVGERLAVSVCQGIDLHDRLGLER